MKYWVVFGVDFVAPVYVAKNEKGIETGPDQFTGVCGCVRSKQVVFVHIKVVSFGTAYVVLRSKQTVKVLFYGDHRLEGVEDGEERCARVAVIRLVEEVFNFVGQMIKWMMFCVQKVSAELFFDAFAQVGPFVSFIFGAKEFYFAR